MSSSEEEGQGLVGSISKLNDKDRKIKKGENTSEEKEVGLVGSTARGEQKKNMVRMTQYEVDHIMSYTPTPFPAVPIVGLPTNLQDKVKDALEKAANVLRQSQESCLKEQEWVQEQIMEKGYVEYEAEDLPRAPPPCRRRYRPGIQKLAGGGIKRVN